MWKGERGSALLYVIVLGALLSIGLAAARLQYFSAMKRSAGLRSRTTAEFLAEAGQEDARARLQDAFYDQTVTPSWEHEVEDLGNYTVDITRPNPDKREVVVVSEGHAYGSSAQTFKISRTYGFRPGRRYMAQVFTDGDINLALSNLKRFDGTLRSNGDINMWWNDLSPESAIIAARQVYDWKLLIIRTKCTQPQCYAKQAKLDIPMPSIDSVTRGAEVIELTKDNTSLLGHFHLGGKSKGLWGIPIPGALQDTSEANPYDFRTHPNNIHIKSDGKRTYTVYLDELIYAGRGTISFAPDIRVRFAFEGLIQQDPLIRRAQSARSESCLALIPFSPKRIRLSFTSFEGILIADTVSISPWGMNIVGSLVARSAELDEDEKSFMTSVRLKTDLDLLLNTPPQVPQGVETYLISENRS